MSTALVKQEILEETNEITEPEEAQAKSADGEHLAKLAQAAEARIENMSLAQLERFVAAYEKSEGRPYRDRPVTDELKFHLRNLRAKVVPAMQAVVDEELRNKAQVWHRKLVRTLKSRELLIPIGATAIVALFWTVWHLVAGQVPITESIEFSRNGSVHLPFAITRWLDVPCVFLAATLFTGTIKLIKKLGEDWDLLTGLALCLGAGLAFGLLVGPGILLYGGLGLGLAGGLIGVLGLGLAGGLICGLNDGLKVKLICGLGCGLAFGLSYELFVGLALTMPVWLPLALAWMGLARYMLKKQRGW